MSLRTIRRSLRAAPIFFAALSIAAAPFCGAAAVTPELHRLHDMTPVSATNPVLARVPTCGIEIPVSEFEGFLRSEVVPTKGKNGPMTPAEKRRQLEQLIDEHFLLWSGYQQKGDQTPGMVSMLTETLEMNLREALVQ